MRLSRNKLKKRVKSIKKKLKGGIRFYDGEIFNEQIEIDNQTMYVECIFANGITFSADITEIIDTLLYKCMINGPIIFPDNITKIGIRSFYECKLSENELILSKNLKYISNDAFYNSSFGKNLYIPKSIEYIGNNAFAKCNNVISVIFDNDSIIDTINTKTFYNCLMLETVILPININIIHRSAFSKCPFLKTIDNIDNIKYIGEYAMSYCFNLNMNINKLLQSADTIYKTAFFGCKNIRHENRPTANVLSRLFKEQFKFDLNTHQNFKLSFPEFNETGIFYGESKNLENINGFSYFESNNQIYIGDYLNNKRQGFIFHLNKKRNQLYITEYTNGMKKNDSYQFKKLPLDFTMNPQLFTFEYKEYDFIDDVSGKKNKKMLGILNKTNDVYIGTWTIHDKNIDLLYFNGFLKNISHPKLKFIERGIHSINDHFFYESEIDYIDRIDEGHQIFRKIYGNYTDIFEDGWNFISHEQSINDHMFAYNICKNGLLEFNIANFYLFPTFPENNKSADELIDIFSVNDPIYKSIQFVIKDKDIIDITNLNRKIQELNREYDFIKSNYIKMLKIYKTTYEKFIPIIEKYFIDLEKDTSRINLPIHSKLRSELINMKTKIGPINLILGYIHSINTNLFVINDGFIIYLQEY
jgi:hypothetical protein